jgi:hypothetical protein
MSKWPIWYHNVVAASTVDIQVGTEKKTYRMREANVEEEATLWPLLEAMYPDYKDYRARIEGVRTIPVLIFEPVWVEPDVDDSGRDSAAVLQPGKYRHFKGGEYQVQGIATHSETGEQLVVYTPLYGKGGLWIRPLSMFLEAVDRDGKQQPRFVYID